MKKLRFPAIVLCAIFALTANVLARTFTDDMRSLQANNIQGHFNLTPITISDIPRDIRDGIGPLAVTFRNPQMPQGWVVYDVRGAQTVAVDIYTRLGTFAYDAPGQSPFPLAGVSQPGMQSPPNSMLHRLMLGDDFMVYSFVNGNLYKLVNTADNNFALMPSDNRPRHFVDYGLDVQVAGEMGNYRSIPMTRDPSHTRMYPDRVRERFVGVIPPGTIVVWVDINDFSSMYVQRGAGGFERFPVSGGMRTTLYQVSFSGQDLMMGSPEPVIPLPPTETEPEPDPTPRPPARPTARPPATPPETQQPNSSSNSPNIDDSEKYEGVVLSPPSSQGGSQSTAQRRQAPQSANPPAAHSVTAETHSVLDEPLEIVRITPASARSGAAPGIILYIIIMVGFVLALLLRKRKQ